MSSITMTLNGKRVRCESGEYLLKVIRREGIDIPALCHHDAVEPYGGCRLCSVEIVKPEWKNWSDVVVSCLYPASDGLSVQTHSAKVIELRKTLMDLYLARCPNTPLIQQMAAEYGITKTSYLEVPEPNDCILCALCVRICDTMGFKAISMAHRGHGREVAPPLDKPPDACVGCLSCALNCPTEYIKFKDLGKVREIWGRKFEMITEPITGHATITKEFAEYLQKHRRIPADYFELSDESHRKALATNMGKIAEWSREEVK